MHFLLEYANEKCILFQVTRTNYVSDSHKIIRFNFRYFDSFYKNPNCTLEELVMDILGALFQIVVLLSNKYSSEYLVCICLHNDLQNIYLRITILDFMTNNPEFNLRICNRHQNGYSCVCDTIHLIFMNGPFATWQKHVRMSIVSKEYII